MVAHDPKLIRSQKTLKKLQPNMEFDTSAAQLVISSFIFILINYSHKSQPNLFIPLTVSANQELVHIEPKCVHIEPKRVQYAPKTG